MRDHSSSRPSGWTVADRTVTVALLATQTAIFLLLMLPSSDVALNVELGGALFVGSGVVAIGGPLVIAVSGGFTLVAFHRGRMMFSIPLAGTLAMVALYIFPIIAVTALCG